MDRKGRKGITGSISALAKRAIKACQRRNAAMP